MQLETDILVVGGGTGGVAAALQAARRGATVVLVSEFTWLGGMLTAAGVSAPDGNELEPLQTGIWGQFLQELRQRQTGGLDHSWVSCFTYEPGVGAEIFADWVRSQPNLKWISGYRPTGVLKDCDRITGVTFSSTLDAADPQLTVAAQLTLDGTDLGDVLALGNVPYRWGWEAYDWGQEPSAPNALDNPQDPLWAIVQHYPVQSPTWVVVMQDYGPGAAVEIPPLPGDADHEAELFEQFEAAWADHGADAFLNYGRLPGDRFMINWPNSGNDYGIGLERLVQSAASRQQFHQAAHAHSYRFARFIQQRLGQRYGLAADTFPFAEDPVGGGAFALQPYYREGRRLQGLATVTELDILPQSQVAPLPRTEAGEVSAIAVANYPNDHHYPGYDLPLQPKSMDWGGRRTGTPFSLPYGALVPRLTDGLLVCDKAISVSHIANGATRLQPAILGIGQAAGMAAALCLEQGCDPRDLNVRSLQTALIQDPTAPAAVVPLLNLPPEHPDWSRWQLHYLEHPDDYPPDGNCPADFSAPSSIDKLDSAPPLSGQFHTNTQGHWLISGSAVKQRTGQDKLRLITLKPSIHHRLSCWPQGESLQIWGVYNPAGAWWRTTAVELMG
jgi:hypothetical protein